jgi:hypothetical protein
VKSLGFLCVKIDFMMMKKLIIIGLMILSGKLGFAQTNERVDQQVQLRKADSAAITKTALNYIEGYYNTDTQRMAKALSPELVKRIIYKDTSGDAIQNMGFSQLLLNTRRNKNSGILNKDLPFKADVFIYDIGKNIATVKVVTNKFKFIDYLHLGRVNGEWKIINVLWEFSDK